MFAAAAVVAAAAGMWKEAEVVRALDAEPMNKLTVEKEE